MTYQELRSALIVFGLGERATLEELKKRHRQLVKQHHPDAGGREPDKIKKINAAYRILQDYIGTYQFLFSEEEFYHQNQEERVRRQFKDDPHWGDG